MPALVDYELVATGTTTGQTLPDRFAQEFNVRDFGALGDNDTIDTDAIQDAADAAIAASGVLYFPAGTYLIDAPITFENADGLTGAVSLRIYGAGQASTIAGNFDDYLFKRLGPGSPEGSGIREVCYLKFINGHPTGGCLSWQGQIGAHVHDCKFDGNRGLNMEYCQSSLIQTCKFERGQGAASYIGSVAATFGESTKIESCDITSYEVGAQFGNGGNAIEGCRFEVCGTGILVGGTESLGMYTASAYRIETCTMESNGIAVDASQCGNGYAKISTLTIIGTPGAAPYEGVAIGATITITGADSGATADFTCTAPGVATVSNVTGTFHTSASHAPHGEIITGAGLPTGTYLNEQASNLGNPGKAATYNLGGTPEYGLKLGTDKFAHATIQNCTIGGNQYEACIQLGNAGAERGDVTFIGVGCSNASLLGGVTWSAPTNAYTATYIDCGTQQPIYTFAGLPGSGVRREGDTYDITDGQKSGGGTAGFGETVSGGSSGKYRVRFDGTNWIRVG